MADYTLEIQIDQAGLQDIYDTGNAIALLQPDSGANYQVVALLTSATSTIYICWNDDFSVYTSSHGLQAYSVLKINSCRSALSGQTFTFDGSSISSTGSTSLPDTVQLVNKSGGTVTSGLGRTFTVGGNQQNLAITSASSLLNNGLGTFQVSNRILLTLLSGAETGMAIPSQVIPNFRTSRKRSISQITAQPGLILDFSANKATQTVHYDDLNGQFVAGALT